MDCSTRWDAQRLRKQWGECLAKILVSRDEYFTMVSHPPAVSQTLFEVIKTDRCRGNGRR